MEAGPPDSLPLEPRWNVSTDEGRWPLWNPDGGQELFYVSPQGVMAVAVDTEPTFSSATPQLLFDATAYVSPFTGGPGNVHIDVSPDGQRFLMLKDEGDSAEATELILLQNWHQELKRLVPID